MTAAECCKGRNCLAAITEVGLPFFGSCSLNWCMMKLFVAHIRRGRDSATACYVQHDGPSHHRHGVHAGSWTGALGVHMDVWASSRETGNAMHRDDNRSSKPCTMKSS